MNDRIVRTSMLSLEKLFYQHQYQPLELSTYLSDYIGDGKGPVKQDECTKRLYQLFLRFFNKFSTFQDQSLSHLILSVSFSVLTHLCENSHATFSNFFQFGLSSVLIEHIPLKTLTENENSFTKFLSMVHLFCDTHKQTQLEPLCHFIVPLLDTISLHHIKIQTKILTSSLVSPQANRLYISIYSGTTEEQQSIQYSHSEIFTGKAIGILWEMCSYRVTMKWQSGSSCVCLCVSQNKWTMDKNFVKLFSFSVSVFRGMCSIRTDDKPNWKKFEKVACEFSQR